MRFGTGPDGTGPVEVVIRQTDAGVCEHAQAAVDRSERLRRQRKSWTAGSHKHLPTSRRSQGTASAAENDGLVVWKTPCCRSAGYRSRGCARDCCGSAAASGLRLRLGQRLWNHASCSTRQPSTAPLTSRNAPCAPQRRQARIRWTALKPHRGPHRSDSAPAKTRGAL